MNSLTRISIRFTVTHCGLVTSYGDTDLGNIGWDNGVLPDDTKPLPEPILTCHQWGIVAFSVSNHQPHDCLLNRLFRRRSKKTSKLRVTGLCVGNSSGTGEFPAQMASNAKNVSIWWRRHVLSANAVKIDVIIITMHQRTVRINYGIYCILLWYSLCHVWHKLHLISFHVSLPISCWWWFIGLWYIPLTTIYCIALSRAVSYLCYLFGGVNLIYSRIFFRLVILNAKCVYFFPLLYITDSGKTDT